METKPTAVSRLGGTTQAGEIRARPPLAKATGDKWAWVEPLVWTDRILTALEQGVKGGKWFSLMDKVWAGRTLRAAFTKVKRNEGSPGMDQQTVKMFESQLEDNLEKMQS